MHIYIYYLKGIRKEFHGALRELKNKEDAIVIFKKELQSKNEEIMSIEERLLSVTVLEFKIR